LVQIIKFVNTIGYLTFQNRYMLLLILNVIFLLSFLAFAYLNLNGADPLLWIPVYLSATICCALAIFEMYYPAVYTLLILFYLVYAGILFFSKKETNTKAGKAKQPFNHNIFGLLIISGALIINYLAAINIL